ncbi:MAG: 4-hydroxy-3-methylbut-2-enyl diphosphate reductase [Nitrospiraceae bacterium]|nr:MAG: 4-hydroxy-3-methylbut-2-enyl diphosphate reductase [Nitrospiraceae bacterium]
MEIIIAKRAGFCFGVKRAMDVTFELARAKEKGIYTFGPIIHNPQVIERLKKEGVAPTEDIHSQDIKTLIIRTHGISPGIYEEIEQEDYRLVDATCPFVKKAQKYARILQKEGYQVAILGDREHPEVIALLGFAGEDAIVINGREPLPPMKGKVGLIVQTTQPVDSLKKVAGQLLDTVKELKVYNTICNSTSLRLEETKRLAAIVDLLLVVGGKNSANTTQLAVLSKNICDKVYHIETADELQQAWFQGVKKIGITGGASTTKWIIDNTIEKIKEISQRR